MLNLFKPEPLQKNIDLQDVKLDKLDQDYCNLVSQFCSIVQEKPVDIKKTVRKKVK
jgi:hypothetical protein